MFDMWERDLTEEETEQILRKIAEKVKSRRMEVPATMALEMHKPLAGVASNAGLVFAPFLVPFLGFDAVNDYTRMLAKRENFDRLMELLAEQDSSDEKQ